MFKLWTQTKYEEHEWETEVIKAWYFTKSDYDHRCLANFENKFNVYQ